MHEKIALLQTNYTALWISKALQDVGTSAMQYSAFVNVSYIFYNIVNMLF